jgi:hypothetical protein
VDEDRQVCEDLVKHFLFYSIFFAITR